ncbi:hypothetical protein WG902_02645 [Ramlibacter sp. PS3R-8]|uniref:hypothetical protein n=1 Tax=Ramlibacter sp. PS3R-8 TaxID=3133437 RepID=UPI0030A70B0F
MSAHASSPARPPVHRLSRLLQLRWAPVLVACALLAACGGGDPSQDSLAAVGALGAGASARSEAAHVAALAHTVDALEGRLAAVEGRAAITARAAAGTYRLLSMSSKTVSGSAGMVLGSRSGISNATLTLAPNGSFTYSGLDRMSGFRAIIPSCREVTAATSPGGFQPSHTHDYQRMNCTTNGFISTERPTRETNTGAGTWRVGPGNTLVITPSDGPGITVYLVQGGTVGFSVSAQDESDSQATGSLFEMLALIKQ